MSDFERLDSEADPENISKSRDKVNIASIMKKKTASSNKGP